MPQRAIQVKYSCRQCGITKRTVSVSVRDPKADVVKWLNEVCTSAVARDHFALSPNCRNTKIDELLIPLPNGKPIALTLCRIWNEVDEGAHV